MVVADTVDTADTARLYFYAKYKTASGKQSRQPRAVATADAGLAALAAICSFDCLLIAAAKGFQRERRGGKDSRLCKERDAA